MIKKPRNWDEVKEFVSKPKIPVGAYVCKIRRGVIQENSYGAMLCILFDIYEGEYRNFYLDDYEENTNQDKKWRGVVRYWLPVDDGSDTDELTKRTFKGLVTALEKSNPGYTWDWNEASLSGKLCGVLFRNEEWEYKGKAGWSARPFRAISVDSVRNGDFRLPKDKPLKKKSTYADDYQNAGYTGTTNYYLDNSEDSELPF